MTATAPAAEPAPARPRRRPQFHPLTVARVERLTDDAVAVTFDVPEELSEFGATACKALRRCRSCREPFEHVKEI